MKKYKRYLKYLIPPAIVMGLTLIIYLIKGIYPFGNLTIAHADMGQSYETFYHLLWDTIRNGQSILYSYVLGSGSNVLGGFLLDGFASPIAWIIALFKRANIKYAFSFLLLIKMMIISVTTYIFLNKVYEKKDKNFEFFKVAFSVIYAMGGYVLINYTNIMWLDIVALFPIFCLGIYRLFNENKAGLFIVTLTLCLIINYYISYMILFFILSCIPFGIMFYVKQENKKRVCGKVIVSVLISLFLSMFSFLPAFTQTMTSYRMAGTIENTIKNDNFEMKAVVLLMSSVALLGTIKLCKHFKKDNNAKVLLLSLLVAGILPVLCERINLLWHTGSYNGFPFRYGFIPTFILINSSLYYFHKYYKEDYKEKLAKVYISDIILIVIATIIVIGLSYNVVLLINRNNPAFGILQEAFIAVAINTVIYLVILEVTLKFENDKIRNTIISLVTISEIIIYGCAYIGVPEEYRGGVEHSDSTLTTANEIISTFKVDENELYRYRDTELLMTENYPVITKTPSISTFLHVITEEQALTHSQLGYSRNYTKLEDAGGTIVSDALLNVKYLITKKDIDDSVCDYIGDTSSGIKMYKYKNNLPIGIVYNNDSDISSIPEDYNVFESQNYIYKQLFNATDNIVDKIEEEGKVEQIDNVRTKYEYNIEVGEKAYLYFWEDSAIIINITVNGEKINIPAMNSYNNVIYPVRLNNGILNLGLFENQNVTIEFEALKNEANPIFALVDVNKYENMFNYEDHCNTKVEINGNKIKITCYTDREGQKIFLPITYDTGWSGKNNGLDIKVNRTFNTYMSVDLSKGENNIELTFIPNNMILGIKISLITLSIVLVYCILKRFIKKDSILDKIIVWIGFIAYIIITLAFYLKVYAISIIKTIKDWL